MATAKKTKAKIKKPAVKRVPTAQLEKEAAASAAKKHNAVAAKPSSAAVSAGSNEGKARRGRPPGSGTKGKPGRKPGQKSAGRPASSEWLYIVRAAAKVDDMGLPASDAPATAIDVMGPFPSEEAAQAAAIEQIGTNTDLEVTLFKDYKRGRPEVKVRLV